MTYRLHITYRLYNIVYYPGASLRHIYDTETQKTLCGRWPGVGRTTLLHREVPLHRLCKNCEKTHARYEVDAIFPGVDAGATQRGAVLANAGRVREVEARVFRVAGSTDTYTFTYTVLIPADKDLASTCTCMAAKTHPETMCKHQSAVFLSIGDSDA